MTELIQSEIIILDNRDTIEYIADFVCAQKRKNTVTYHYLTILEATHIPLKLVTNKKTKEKNRDFRLFSKSQKVSLNRLYSRGRSA